MKYYTAKIRMLEVPSASIEKYTAPKPVNIFGASPTKKSDSKQQPLQANPDIPLITKYFVPEFKQACPTLSTTLQKQAEDNASTLPRKASSAVIAKPVADDIQMQEIKDDFFMLVACNVSHLAYDFAIAPNAHTSNGLFDLIVVRKKNKPPPSRATLLKLFLEVGSGSHVGTNDVFDEHKVKAFYLEPISTGSFVSIDGECVKYMPILVEIHAGLGNIMCI